MKQKPFWTGVAITLLAIAGTGYLVGRNTRTPEPPPKQPDTRADSAIAAPDMPRSEAPLQTSKHTKPAEPACAGCSVHEPVEPADGTEHSALTMTADIRNKLFNVGKNSPITFALPGNKNASGTVEMIRQKNGRTVMIQGSLTAPQEGRFFFQLQSMPGVAGSMVGVVTFDEGDVAYSVEPGSDGEPVLYEKHADDVFCRKYAVPPPSAPLPEEMPEDHPDNIVIPDYQNGVIPLSSLPGALAVVYLDFDGEKAPYENWSANIDAEPYDLSSAQIKDMWVRVAEEFAPFNINVTTDLQVYLDAPENSRQRCVITKTAAIYPGAGGVAWLNSFNWEGDVPCWCFNHGSAGALVIAHEVGHTFDLSHDGTYSGGSYYGGHGSGAMSWGPIMGAPYGASITHWSKGEYNDANQTQDDLAIIASKNNVALRADDHGETLATASLLEIFPDHSAEGSGIIETDADSDSFRFTLTASATVSLSIELTSSGANLDVLAELVDSTNTVIDSDNPDTALNATVGGTLAAGDYFIRLTGVRRDPVLDDGFSSYGSLGFYRVTGTAPNAVQPDRFALAENPSPAASIGTVLPRNSHGADPIAFAIAAGNGSGAFALNSSSGELTVADATQFDYEALTSHYDDPAIFELYVDITNTNTPSLNETVRVVVELTNVNEAPVITGGGTATLLEHTQTGTELLTISSIDTDPFDFTTYAITAGNTGNAFAIGASSGKLTVAADIDAAQNPSYTLTVTISDQGTPALTDSTNVVVTMVDIAPGYTPGTISHVYYENIDGNSVSDLTSAPAFPEAPDYVTERTRIEAGSYGGSYGSVFRGFVIPPTTGSYTFWVSSDDASRFYLSTDADPSNMVEIASVADWTDYLNHWDKYTSQQSAAIAMTAGEPYYLEIRHKEGGGGDHVSAAWQGPGFSRTIVPGLYLAPHIPNYAPSIGSETLSIPENAFIGTVAATVSVTDPNPGDSHGLFTITGGDPGNAFAVDPATGVITVADTAQLTAGSTFNLQVQTTDDGTPPHSGSGTITINVTEANPIAPGTIIQEVWTGISGNMVSLLTGHANYPDSPNYTRTLSEFDSGENIAESYGSRIRAYVIPPTTGSYTFYIASDDNGRLLFSTDTDPLNAATVATVSTGVGWTGHNEWTKYSEQQAAPVSLTAGQKYYIETLHKEGSGGDHVSVGWSGPGIAVPTVIDGAYLDGNINIAPVWDAAPYAFSAANTDTNGTVVGTVSATDNSADLLLYNILSGNEAGGFAIDPDTGIIILGNHLDLTPGIHVLQVGVQDQGGGTYPFGTATTDVTITVSGNNIPVVTNEAFSVVENRMAGTVAGTVQASDADPGDILTYAITAGNGAGAFTINTNSGTITTTAPLNHEVEPQYILTVTAADEAGFIGIGTITIHVTDQDESTHGGVTAWEEQVHTGTIHLHKRTDTLAGNTTATVDLSGISGDATYEFIVHAEELGQTEARLLDSNSWSLRFEQWNNTTELGVTRYGSADYTFTAEAGQSTASPYGALHHMVFVVDTASTQTRVYVDGILVGTLAQIPALASSSATLGFASLRNDATPGIHAFAAYNSALTGTEISAHYHAWFDHLFVDSDSDTLDDNWEIGQYGSIGVHTAAGNPDGDTLDMFGEMAFGGNALVYDAASDFAVGSITNGAGGISMIFSYRRAKVHPRYNINYQFQICEVLESNAWTDDPSAPDYITDDPDGTTEWVTHIIPIPPGSDHRFFRCIAEPQ